MTFWENKRVIVTGSNGFLGSTLLKLLVEAGADTVGFDMHSTSPSIRALGLEGRVPIIRGSVTDLEQIERAMINRRVEICFHLAGLSNIGENSRNPLHAFDVNVRGTWTVLEACRRVSSLLGVVCASSNHIYGFQDDLPAIESAPLNQLDTYGAAKSCADLIGRAFAKDFDLPCVMVRNTNSYGPGDPHIDHIIAGSMVSLLRNERPVIRSDGSPTKAYLYSQDTMEAYMLLARNISNIGVKGEAFNVTANEPVTVLNLVNMIVEVSGKPELSPIVEFTDLSQQGTVEHLSDTKIRESLGWTPKFSLEDGLIRTYRWYEEHGVDQWLR